MTNAEADLRTLVHRGAPAFALLHRPGRAGGDLEILVGEPVAARSIAEIPLPPAGSGVGDRPEVLAVLPYRQIAERGLDCVDDGEQLIAIEVRASGRVPVSRALRELPDTGAEPGAGAFDRPDEDYAELVRRVVDTNIGRGDGSNFVLRRTWRTRLPGCTRRNALSVFRRLLTGEQGAYWTFLVHWNGRTLVGASPECHIRLSGGVATMNPISGTYRYPGSGPDAAGLARFLTDRKEVDELAMVVDEELKVMARVCTGGGRLRGPFLRPMSRLAHTEYLIEGPSDLDVREVLRLATPAPTVTGSPVATACRVIAEHERTGRGYYGGVLARFGRDGGRRVLDSALIIRTADLGADGAVAVGAGATLVRHSDPRAEAAETRVKVESVLRALRRTGTTVEPASAAPIDAAWASGLLAARNAGLSGFWRGSRVAPGISPVLAGRRLLIIEAGDDFTAMLARMAESLGLDVRVRRWDERWRGGRDLTLVGPGPGDPRDRSDPRIARLHAIVRELVTTRTPTLAVCLGHQVLADELGLTITRSEESRQGLQRIVPVLGRPERVGFYNTFVATSAAAEVVCPLTGDRVTVERDEGTATVHALSKPFVRSMQFHVESLLTERGPAILRKMLIAARAGGDGRKAAGTEFGKVHHRSVGGRHSSGR
jgi:phenazine biosynthesis protein phzE